jgi:hypothetical protein
MIYKIANIILLILVFIFILFYHDLTIKIVVSNLDLLFALYNIILPKIKTKFKSNYISKIIILSNHITL